MNRTKNVMLISVRIQRGSTEPDRAHVGTKDYVNFDD